ncbi:DUF952 domain-containing protein [Paenibacillus sp. OV219]|uniref:DUF952 domain-containing protein n=1 Tax=Paenibacillus sp. OV219 TaxID=1884377 RepID=UPI0008CAD83D|nr:DUF952 domain-containing protein [Paenibacillus sp. OV219]SEN96432.1 Uncharacterized conserved protein, DUF952 family [Paenibacillus sp. OV219]
MILHIVKKSEWEEAQKNGVYAPSSLETDKFIHCSTSDQVIDVANDFYKGSKDLLLLCIDENKVSPKIVYEDLYNTGKLFPHIYGALEIDSVDQVIKFEPNSDGLFSFPIGIST